MSEPSSNRPSGRPGIAVDALGGGVVDPTQNVKDLSEAANKRQDDLREAFVDWVKAEIDNLKHLLKAYAEHQKELTAKESSRLDSIRQVDEVNKTTAQAQNNLAIATLAKQTTDLQTTLQTQVASAANAVEARRQADMAEVNKRVSALELALSASTGKSTATDPMTATLAAEVKALREANSTRTGFDAGKAAVVAAALAAAGLAGGGGVALMVQVLKS